LPIPASTCTFPHQTTIVELTDSHPTFPATSPTAITFALRIYRSFIDRWSPLSVWPDPCPCQLQSPRFTATWFVETESFLHTPVTQLHTTRSLHRSSPPLASTFIFVHATHSRQIPSFTEPTALPPLLEILNLSSISDPLTWAPPT